MCEPSSKKSTNNTIKASYAIKSEVYCEKCAVELITKKGMIAIKIDRDNDVKEER